MNILVTGCAGFIGFSLVKELIKIKKYKVIGLDNLNNISRDIKLKKLRLKLRKKIDFFNLHLQEKNKLRKIFKKYNFEYVIHLVCPTRS